MHEALNETGLACLKPMGAFYIFPSIRGSGLSSLEFAQRLLREQKVAVVPGVAFGKNYDAYVRMSYATNYNQLKKAVDRMKVFMRQCARKA